MADFTNSADKPRDAHAADQPNSTCGTQSKASFIDGKPVQTIVLVGTTILLAISLVVAGFAACVVPRGATEMLARATVTGEGSPFTCEELVQAAVATRDYTFWDHDLLALERTQWAINESAHAAGRDIFANSLDTSGGTAACNDDAIRAARFSAASDVYVLTPDALAHLDDIFRIIEAIRLPLAAAVLFAIAGAAHLGVRCGRRMLGRAFAVSGGIVLSAFALIGVFAVVDFDGFFTFFHSLFFANGTWLFSWRSLLICSLPEAFWMGMAALWLATTATLSILLLVIGVRLIRTKRNQKRVEALDQ